MVTWVENTRSPHWRASARATAPTYVLERDAVENDAIDATFTLQQAKSMAAPGSLFRPCARRPA